jgi:hypothetical protein
MTGLTRQQQDEILAAHGITELAPDEIPIFDGEDFFIVRPRFHVNGPRPSRRERRAAASDARKAGR